MIGTVPPSALQAATTQGSASALRANWTSSRAFSISFESDYVHLLDVLALANGLYVLALVAGGVIVPLDRLGLHPGPDQDRKDQCGAFRSNTSRSRNASRACNGANSFA